ncbi:hypothetical protein HBE96_16150 [Clostridium sp. P21]|uniref:Uncharacterized protein n=1 Tax=Clostridium muellerianum TaxID=2716538 RepID=A0A7Y0EIL8_9CLOT|nr:hypothetical protein [Clostridium muellerianum]NMM64160.1 hypothetical protein [Clostridium muellerianum]
MDSGIYISIESDILTQDADKYEIKQYSISFVPRQIYNLDKFFNYLNELNKNGFNGFNEEQLRIAEQFKIKKQRAKQLEIQNFINTLNKIKQFKMQKVEAERQLKIQQLEAKQREEERIKAEEERIKAIEIEK